MDATQKHLLISDIKDDLILLKDGGAALILQVGAVNFGLLSEREQVAIIATFAQMLNSLSFSIQILIHSERLNISSYLEKLGDMQKVQTNPLLSNLIGKYRTFIQKVVKDNDVLDKRFYLVVPAYSVELGLSSKEAMYKKAKILLIPRRDQLIRQLNRTGLSSDQLTTEKLIALFHNLYNYSPNQAAVFKPLREQMHIEPVQLKTPVANIQTTQPPSQPQVIQQPIRDNYISANKHVPFVVEELPDN